MKSLSLKYSDHYEQELLTYLGRNQSLDAGLVKFLGNKAKANRNQKRKLDESCESRDLMKIQLRYLSRKILHTQEEERKRISRERQVLQLIAERKANKETAYELLISIKTVEKHRSNVMRKLDIHDTEGLTRFAIGAGMIESGVQPTAETRNLRDFSGTQ